MQLYVSVDAATKEKLKAIDRPLFSDFWERFIVSILCSRGACMLLGCTSGASHTNAFLLSATLFVPSLGNVI